MHQETDKTGLTRARYLGEDPVLAENLFAALAKAKPALEKPPEGEQGRILGPDHDAVLFFDERGAKPADAVEAQLAHLREMFGAVVKIFGEDSIHFSFPARDNCDALLDSELAGNRLAVFATLEEVRLKKEGRFEQVEAEKRAYVQAHFADKYLALLPVWKAAMSKIQLADAMDMDFITRISNGFALMGEQLQAIKDHGFDENRIMHDLGNSFMKFTFMTLLLKKDHGESHKMLVSLKAAFDEFNAYRRAIEDARNGRLSWTSVSNGGFKGSEKGGIEKLFADGTMDVFRGRRVLLVDDNEGVLQSAQSVLARAGAKVFSLDPRNDKNLAGDFVGNLDAIVAEGLAPELILLDNDLGQNSLGAREFGHEFIEMLRLKFPRAIILCHSADALALSADKENPYTRAGVSLVNKMDFARVAEKAKAIPAAGGGGGGGGGCDGGRGGLDGPAMRQFMFM